MALIDCPDCGKQVSSNAPTCPNCGAPIALALGAQPKSAPKVQTVEQTSKVWKAMELIGVMLTFGGCGSFFVAEHANVGGMVAMFVGSAIYAIGRLSAWWYHA